MTAEWRQTSPPVDISKLLALLDGITGASQGLAAVLDLIAAALDLAAIVVQDGPDVVSAVVTAAVQTIEAALIDLLSNNVGLAVHLNMYWDPRWRFVRAPGETRTRHPDYVHDGLPPYSGTGIDGWLIELAMSTADPSDPYRPIAGPNAGVQGIIVVKGGDSDEAAAALRPFFVLFQDFKYLADRLDLEASLRQLGAVYRSLVRTGPMAWSAEAQGIALPPEYHARDLVKGWLVTGGTGSNAAGDTLFVDNGVRFGEHSFGGQRVVPRVGDTLAVPGSRYTHVVTDILSPSEALVHPPILQENVDVEWELRRGGLDALAGALPQTSRDFLPGPGNYPMWVTVPIASLLPGLDSIFRDLYSVAQGLKPGLLNTDALRELADLARKKNEALLEQLDKLERLLEAVEALTNFLLQSHIIVINVPNGGLARFAQEAMSAPGKPDFGPRGIVGGFSVIATAPDSQRHLESFFQFVGVEFSALTDETTARVQDLEDAWGDLFP